MTALAAPAGTYYRYLGLRRGASLDEVEQRCQDLLDWLDEVPEDLQPWAKRQVAVVEECYGALTGTTTASRTAPELRLLEPEPSAVSRLTGLLTRPVGMAILGALLGLAIVGVTLLSTRGLPGLGTLAMPSPALTSQSAAGADEGALPVDAARVAKLEAAVAANPADSTALFDLGETYMHAKHWERAVQWFGRLLALDATRIDAAVDVTHAQTDVAIAYLNLGQQDRAEPLFLEVLAKQPSNPQIHYSLGFLYASGSAPALDKAVQHWQETVRLAPDSQWGAAARTHLTGIQGAK